MNRVKRDLHYVAPTIKKKIITKIVFYWATCLVFSTLPLMIGTTLVQPDRLFIDTIGELASRFWPLYVMILGLLPFALRDALRLTNRTLGPLKRLRFELTEFKKTGTYNPVNSRDDDFLHDLIQDINEAILNKSSSEDKAEPANREFAEPVV